MKKFIFLIALLLATPASFCQSYQPLTDSIFTYLQGTWYQSYKVVNNSLPCPNGVQKHPGLPAHKITYQKTSASQGIIVKEKGVRFHSTYLNWGFESAGIAKDTIHLEYNAMDNTWKSISNVSFLPMIETISGQSHLMRFYEFELVGFERDPYWSLASFLINNKWAGGSCKLTNGEMLCLTMVTYAAFTLKNDTLAYWSHLYNAPKLFVYRYATHSFEAIDHAATKISIEKDSSIIISDGLTFRSSYERIGSKTVVSNVDFKGVWNSLEDPSESLSFLNDGDTLINCPLSPLVRCSGDLRAVARPDIHAEATGNAYLQVIQSSGCVPQLSKFILTKNKTELWNITTGERYLRLTSLAETSGPQLLSLKMNPVHIGENLEVLGMDKFNYQVFSALGHLIDSGEAQQGIVGVKDLRPGYYILHAKTDQSFFTAKFVIE